MNIRKKFAALLILPVTLFVIGCSDDQTETWKPYSMDHTDPIGFSSVVTSITDNGSTVITSPCSGSQVLLGSTLIVTAQSQDPDGVSGGRLWIDGEFHSLDKTPPYQFIVENLSPGEHTMFVRGRDMLGNANNSEPVTITVVEEIIDDESTAIITSPENGAILNEGDNLYVRVEPSDSDGVKRVWLSINGKELIRTEGAEPYEWGADGQNDSELQNLQAGTYTLMATVKDNLGNFTAGEVTTITVKSIPEENSSVVITSPADGATLYAGDDLYVKVDASDTDGIHVIWLSINGKELKRGEGEEPYEWGAEGQNYPELQNLQPGTYTLSAKAKDNLGNFTTSQVITINVIPWLNIYSSFQSTLSVPAGDQVLYIVRVISSSGGGSLNFNWESYDGNFSGEQVTSTNTFTESRVMWTAPNCSSGDRVIKVTISNNNNSITKTFLPVTVLNGPMCMVHTPVFDLPAGEYEDKILVTLSTDTPGATIKYTMDGSDPRTSATAIVGSTFEITESSTINAYAYSSGWEDSNIATADYTIIEQDVWPKRLGGTGSDRAYGITTDINGNIILTGYVSGDADFNGDKDTDDGGGESSAGYGDSDAYIIKFDIKGGFLWSKRLGGDGQDSGQDIATDSLGNIVVSGKVTGAADLNGDGDKCDGYEEWTSNDNSDGYITKFDPYGNYLWSKRLGSTTGNDRAYKIAVDKGDNIIVTGYVEGAADLNGDGDTNDCGGESSCGYGNGDIFISKFNPNGAHLWSKRLGGKNKDLGFAITTDSFNNIIVSGYVEGAADLNGDGDVNDGGGESSCGYGSKDIFISKFNANGARLWSKRHGGTCNDMATFARVDSQNNIFLTGQIMGDVDFNGDGDSNDQGEKSCGYGNGDAFLVKYNTSGKYLWAKRFGGSSSDAGRRIVIGPNDTVYVTGFINGDGDINGDGSISGTNETGRGGSDIFLSGFDTNGCLLYSSRLGGNGDDSGLGLIVDPDPLNPNNLLITGYVDGFADLNGDGDYLDEEEDPTVFDNLDIFISKIGTHD